MLTNIILAGLIPGMMAKPVMTRQSMSAIREDRADVEHKGSYYVNSARPLAFTAALPSVLSSAASARPNATSLAAAAADPAISTFPVAPPPMRSASPVAAAQQGYAIHGPPAARAVAAQEYAVRPSVTPSVAAQNLYAVHASTYAASVPAQSEYAAESSSEKASVNNYAASSVPAQNYYAVGSQPGSPYAAHSSHTPYAAHSSHVPYAAHSSSAVYAAQSSAPYVAHSAPAQNYYVVATPSGSSSAHHPSTSSIPKQSQYAVGSSYVHHPSSSYAATSVPAQNEYGVGSSSAHHPSASYAATSVPAQNEYGVGSSSHHSPAPYAATSIPAQNQYAVGSSPVHHAPASSVATTIPKQSQYAIGEGPAPYSEAAYPGPSASHPHHEAPAYASAPAPYATSYTTAPSYVTETPVVSYVTSYTTSPSYVTQDPAYETQTSAVYAPAAPSAVNEDALDKEAIDTTNPAVTNSQCGQQCIIRCQSADIAFEVAQCRASCLEGCAMAAKSGRPALGSPLINNAVAHDGSIAGSKAKANGKPSMDNPPVTFGAGTVSFEACMESCKSKFQHADIAFDVSTGKSDCKAACAAYSAEGAGVNLKRADKPKPKSPLNPPEPVFAAGAGTTAYQACLKQCHYEFQSADIALPVSQGKGGCAQACAAKYTDGSGVAIAKRALKPFEPKPVLQAGAGTISYEVCMKDCHGKWQSADIAFDVSTGKQSCKVACAKYASDGSGVVAKRDTASSSLHRGDAEPSAIVKKEPQAFPFKHHGPFDNPPELVAGAGTQTYEQCVADCKAGFQNTGAGGSFGSSQGLSDCRAACAKAAAQDGGVVHYD